MASKIIKKLATEENKNGTIYTISYFVHAASIAPFLKDYGDSADSWTGGSSTYIAKATYPRAGQHYYVNYTAYSEGYEDTESGGGGSFQSSTDVFRNYPIGELYMDPKWWGAVKATQADIDAGYYNVWGALVTSLAQFVPAVKSTSPPVPTDFKFDDCPYAADASNTVCTVVELPVKYIDQKIPDVFYKIKLIDVSDIDDFVVWYGVNPANVTTAWGVTRNQPYLTSGRVWKSSKQDLEEKAERVGGVLYNRVTRYCQRAPEIDGNQLFWISDKNTGEWIWSN